MSERVPASRVRITLTTALLSLCVLFASGMSHRKSWNTSLATKPSVELRTSNTVITLPCPPGACSSSWSCPLTIDFRLPLAAFAYGFSRRAVYAYSASGGRIVGEGTRVIWDLSDVGPGLYTATVEVADSAKRRANSSVTIKVQNCMDCVNHCYGWCPTLAVICYEEVKAGTPITCKAVINGARLNRITYQWSARDSDDNDLTASIAKQGEYVSIPTKGLGVKAVITTVEIKELDPSCSRTASGSTRVKP
jgi:hypothetical protein